jgi:prefoldin subunit 5
MTKLEELKEKEAQIQERLSMLDRKIATLENRQLAVKTAMNSLYGALG